MAGPVGHMSGSLSQSLPLPTLAFSLRPSISCIFITLSNPFHSLKLPGPQSLFESIISSQKCQAGILASDPKACCLWQNGLVVTPVLLTVQAGSGNAICEPKGQVGYSQSPQLRFETSSDTLGWIHGVFLLVDGRPPSILYSLLLNGFEANAILERL